jgi:hypothetical protein
VKGELVHHDRSAAGVLASLHQGDLVVLLGVGALEDDLWIARQWKLAAVGHLETQEAGVERDHGLDVVYVDAYVAEANTRDAAHDLLLLVS